MATLWKISTWNFHDRVSQWISNKMMHSSLQFSHYWRDMSPGTRESHPPLARTVLIDLRWPCKDRGTILKAFRWRLNHRFGFRTSRNPTKHRHARSMTFVDLRKVNIQCNVSCPVKIWHNDKSHRIISFLSMGSRPVTPDVRFCQKESEVLPIVRS